MPHEIEKLADAAISGRMLDDSDAARLVQLSQEEPCELLHAANRIRQHYKGNDIRLCSIINARSGACSENCRFCAQSAHNPTGTKVYPLLERDKIVQAAREAKTGGAGHFGIVTSGRSVHQAAEIDEICGAIQEFDAKGCASLGTISTETALKLKAAGVRRYNHNLETSRSFFPSICTTHNWEDRVATVKTVIEAGVEVCCGGIFGLGENWSHRIELALQLRELGVHGVPINFLNPIPGTPLEKQPILPAMEGLRIIAIYRFMLPDKDIKVAGGRNVCLGDLQSWMFYAGANSTMIGNYLTTLGRPPEQDIAMIEALGLRIVQD